MIPGPPLSYVSLILVSWAHEWEAFSPAFLVVMGVISLLVTVLDNILPVYIPRRYGATKFGVWGSALGMLAGLVLFPPLGLFIGAFLGAMLGELIFNRNKKVSLKAALGVFVGSVAAILLKLSVSGVIAVYYVREVVKG